MLLNQLCLYVYICTTDLQKYLYTNYLLHGMLEKKIVFCVCRLGGLQSFKRGIHLAALETKRKLLLK